MTVIEIESEQQFKDIVTNCTTKFIVADFYAQWCGPCKQIKPYFEQLSEKYTDITFVKVDIDKNEQLEKTYNVKKLPTFVFFDAGSLTTTYTPVVGSKMSELSQSLKYLIDGPVENNDF